MRVKTHKLSAEAMEIKKMGHKIFIRLENGVKTKWMLRVREKEKSTVVFKYLFCN